MTNEKADRVLSRMGARELTQEQITHVAGGENCTFFFTRIPNPDTVHDCK